MTFSFHVMFARKFAFFFSSYFYLGIKQSTRCKFLKCTHTHSQYIDNIGDNTSRPSQQEARERKKSTTKLDTTRNLEIHLVRDFFFILSLDGYFLIFICLCSKWILQCNKMRIMFIWYCIQRHTHTHTQLTQLSQSLMRTHVTSSAYLPF